MSHDLPLINLSANGAPVRTRDRLVIRVSNLGAAFNFIAGGRLLQQDGTQTDLQLSKSIAAGSLNNEFSFNLIDGWLLTFQANAQGVIIRQGDIWVEAFLAFGSGNSTQRYRTIFTGYMDQFSSVGWPVVDRRVPRDGPGRLLTPSFSGPAAGAQWSTISNGNAAQRYHSISALLTTNANVANRRVSITMEESGGGIIAEIPFVTAQIASTVARYTVALGASHTEDPNTNIFIQTLPDVIQIEDWLIMSKVINMQAGDAWSQITGGSERWNDVQL